MPWIEFKADQRQIQKVFEAILSEFDCHLYEAYSDPDRELKIFESNDEIEKRLRAGSNGQFSLWINGVMPQPNIRKFKLNAGGTRQVVEGCGLFSIQLEDDSKNKIGYFTEPGARQQCTVEPGPDTVNWKNHRQAANALRRIVKREAEPANKRLQGDEASPRA